MKPSGRLEIKETKGGGQVYLNGVELFVIADSLEIHDISDGDRKSVV